jgi:hypothetical protein
MSIETARDVAQARHCRQNMAERLTILERELEQVELYQAVKRLHLELETARLSVAAAEERHRQALLEEFRATGEKKLPGGQVKAFTVFEYDPEKARQHCLNQLPLAVKIDYKIFEQHAKAVAKTAPLPFVTIREDYRAQVASDLGEYLDGEA